MPKISQSNGRQAHKKYIYFNEVAAVLLSFKTKTRYRSPSGDSFVESVSTLIGQLEAVDTSHDVWQLFLDFVGDRGFKCATYGYSYAPINSRVETENGKDTHVRVSLAGRTWITSMPKEGVEEYRSRKYEKVDPMIHQIEKRSMQPLYMARELLDPRDPNFEGFDFILQRAALRHLFRCRFPAPPPIRARAR